MQHKFLTTDQLRERLNVLSSSGEKLRFLQLIYLPGFTAVVDLMIELNGEDLSSDFLKKELEVVISNNNNELIEKYGKLFVDYYFKNDLVTLLDDELHALQSNTLTQYVLNRLPQSQSEAHLQEAEYFYEKMGIQNETVSEISKKLLKIKLRDTRHPWNAAQKLVKLKRYEEAINHYLKAGEQYYLRCAWGIAKEHAPQRKRGIAEKIFSLGLNEDSDEVAYVECAQELSSIEQVTNESKEDVIDLKPNSGTTSSGFLSRLFFWLLQKFGFNVGTPMEIRIMPVKKLSFIEQATKELKTWVAKQKPNSGRFFNTLVKALKILNLNSEIDEILRITRKYTNSLEGYCADQYGEMVELCFIAGELEECKDWNIRKLEYELRECNPSYVHQTIAVYRELTGNEDELFEYILFPLFEREKKYEEARKFALRLGLIEKARQYEDLIDLLPPVPVSEVLNKLA